MNELQRQAYLSALGIDNYMPRCLMAHAPASVLCVLPDVTGHDSQPTGPVINPASAAVMHLASDPVPTPSDTGEHRAPLGVQSLQSQEKTSPPDSKLDDALEAFALGSSATKFAKGASKDAAPLAAATDARPKFSLTIWRVNADIMIVDTRDLQLALPTERLLSNMLIALGYQLPSLPKANVLKWPMIDNDPAGQGIEDARDMLHAFLDAELLLDPVKHLWLMGAAAATYILPPSHTYPEVIDAQLASAQPIILEALATPLVVTPSLVDILQNPSLKSQVWRVIQPLIAKR